MGKGGSDGTAAAATRSIFECASNVCVAQCLGLCGLPVAAFFEQLPDDNLGRAESASASPSLPSPASHRGRGRAQSADAALFCVMRCRPRDNVSPPW